jgi:diguanylate cyclase (GGDEF)-like protein
MAVSSVVSNTSGMGLMSRLRNIEDVELFRDVPLSSLRYFLQRCREQVTEPGSVILSPHQINQRLFIILEGAVTVHIGDLHSEPITEMTAGESFGEMSAFDGSLPSAWIKARNTCIMLVIERETLWAMINLSHGVARNMLGMLARRLRSNNRTISVVQRERDLHHAEANCDALTGVYNRRWLENLIVHWSEGGKDMVSMGPLSVIMLDVDHFKRFNDTWGHASGDLVLKRVAQALSAELRPQDRVSRFGGEEFVVVLPRTSRAGASRVAERLRERIESTVIAENGQILPSITASLGVAQCHVGKSLQDTLEEADMALYRAKEAGRNRVMMA